ncbi:MAG: ABC transporter permease [Xanthomonadaceae bacterium]|nr:ABC transporter permease [Xanthomonadaceae bacterium]
MSAFIKGRNLWSDAWIRITKDRFALLCFITIVGYGLVAILAKFGMIAMPWDVTVGGSYQAPSLADHHLWLGTDLFGRSVLYKVIHGTRIAMSVGLMTSIIAIPIGMTLGALAGYFGGWIDDLVVWFYTTLTSIPNIMLLIAIAYVMGRGITSVYIAIGATSWVGLARVIRAEVMKHKERDYVLAASSLGASHSSRIFKHIMPNVFHQVILNFTMQFQTAIRSEVILSYLGLGVQGQPSWGVMIDDAKLELSRQVWWQLTGATLAMFILILALNIFGDTLRDALDPKVKT